MSVDCKRDARKRPGKLGGVAVADGIDVDSVPDLDATGAKAPMQATPADHARRITCPEHPITEPRPLPRRCRDVFEPRRCSAGVRTWLAHCIQGRRWSRLALAASTSTLASSTVHRRKSNRTVWMRSGGVCIKHR
jgi:hypothetical protein